MRVPWTLVKYNNDHTYVPWCWEGLKNVFFFRKGKYSLAESQKSQGPLPNEGPWQVMGTVGGSTCVPRVPWYDFWCLECKNIANIVNFPLWLRANLPLPSLIKDSETSAWWGLSYQGMSWELSTCGDDEAGTLTIRTFLTLSLQNTHDMTFSFPK